MVCSSHSWFRPTGKVTVKVTPIEMRKWWLVELPIWTQIWFGEIGCLHKLCSSGRTCVLHDRWCHLEARGQDFHDWFSFHLQSTLSNCDVEDSGDIILFSESFGSVGLWRKCALVNPGVLDFTSQRTGYSFFKVAMRSAKITGLTGLAQIPPALSGQRQLTCSPCLNHEAGLPQPDRRKNHDDDWTNSHIPSSFRICKFVQWIWYFARRLH